MPLNLFRFFSSCKSLTFNFFNKLKSHFYSRYTVAYVEDAPDDLKALVLYIVGEKHIPWQAEFLCPCKCGDKIVLPLNKEVQPNWDFLVKAGIPTLRPSIWRTKGCKSHFFIKDGFVIWVKHLL